MKKRAGLTGIFLFLIIWSHAQYFSTGEDPASLKWRQIVTENFQLIYPSFFEEKAQQVAHYFEKVYDYGSYSLNHRPRKISVIIHTQTVKSNGLVGWAPRRIELFTPPHQGIYAQDWLEQLALHEFRHVVQVDKISRQLPEIVKALLGEQAAALVTGMYLPWWFIEGDAVVTETALSHTGRGRFPSFLMEHRAQVVEKGVFPFDKAINGSFRDFVPDHYKLGYYLVGESRVKYGSALWNEVLNQASQSLFSLVPTNRALKKRSGLNQAQLYRSVFDSLKTVWQNEDRLISPSALQIFSTAGKTYTEYRYNHFLTDDRLISLKWSYDEIPKFVEIDKNGGERTICVPGQIFEESVGYRGRLIVWSESVPDVRWSHSGRSVIRLYDVDKKTQTSLNPEFKCFAPAISPDEQNVAVVETDFANHYYLSIYNAATGSLTARYQSPDNNYLFSPAWLDDRELVVVALTSSGKKLATLNPLEKKFRILPQPDLGEIRQLRVNDGKVYFIGGFSGRDELYVYNLVTTDVYRVGKARFGFDSPALNSDGTQIAISDFTSEGFRLGILSESTLSADYLHDISRGEYRLAEALTTQEKGIVDFSTADTAKYNSKKYHKLLHLFNFHSWAPLFFDINSYEVKPGFSMMSQNKLGTAETMLGYKCNLSEKAGQFYTRFEYRGWFPVLSAELTTGKRASSYYLIQTYKNSNGQIIRQDTTLKRFAWDETNLSLNVRTPLNFSQGKYYRLMQPELKYDLTFYKHRPSTPENFPSGSMQTLSYRLYYHQLQKQSYRDLMPNWGWIVDLSLRHSPAVRDSIGNLAAFQVKSYWPGLLPNHGFSVYGGFQQRERGEKYSFGDVVRMPRGEFSIMTNQLASCAFDYKFPLFYPDWNLGRWIYIRRVKASLFYDYAWMQGDIRRNGKISGSFNRNVSTLGTELLADANFLRFYAPANIGFRTIYLANQKQFAVEFLFSVDFKTF